VRAPRNSRRVRPASDRSGVALASIANFPASRARARKAFRSSSWADVWLFATINRQLSRGSARRGAGRDRRALEARLSLRFAGPLLERAGWAPLVRREPPPGSLCDPAYPGRRDEARHHFLFPAFASIVAGSICKFRHRRVRVENSSP